MPRNFFGAQLRKLRLSLDITQQELAARVGVSPNYITRLERGVYVPSYTRERIEMIALLTFNRAAILVGEVNDLGRASSAFRTGSVGRRSFLWLCHRDHHTKKLRTAK